MSGQINDVTKDNGGIDLHPWSVAFGFLLDEKSDDVVKLINRTGLQVDWRLTKEEKYSNTTRNRAYAPRVQKAYNLLPNEKKLVVASILAKDLADFFPGKVHALNERLTQIGWKIDSGRIVPAALNVVELFFPPGSQYDAYIEIRSLLKKATESVDLIDPYFDSSVLSPLSTVAYPLSVRVLTYRLPNDFQAEAKKFIAQHDNISLKVRKTQEFHDRFIIVDGIVCYHIGASIKDAGNKAFMISQVEDPNNCNALITQLNQSWNSATEIPFCMG